MTKRIFRSICIVALAVLIASVALIMGGLYGYFSGVQHNQLKMQTDLAAQGVNNEGIAYFEELNAKNYRITIVDPSGTVIYDSQVDPLSMENHFEREEIKEALANGYGKSERYSSTLMEKTIYSAKMLDDGTVVRLSIAQSSILTLVLGMLQPICVVIVVAIALSLFLAYRLSKNIVKPLNELNLDEPLSNEGYDELSPLLLRIHSQQKQLKRQSNELQKSRDEFEAITDSMREGLILLNPKCNILSINQAATHVLNTDQNCVGKNIITVNRSLALQEVLSNAIGGQQSQKVIESQDRHYQFNASPVFSDKMVSGIALLIFDVTEKENSEQMRREFTANVSHELRTPLHSISGYAELLKNGMVKSDDLKPISSKIYGEAQRMVHLVDDIINLSHLDEGAEGMSWENINLYDLAQNTILSLEPEANLAEISLNLTGAPVIINGIQHLVSSIIYNLCENAIKYNLKGGKVTIDVAENENTASVTVTDTGIGISADHQSRIFERFYRVDKSHSNEVGGTGLGLSIVKHAAKVHNANIKVNSTIGKGTAITVEFEK